MFKSVVPLSAERHKKKRLKNITSYRFAADETLCPIMAAEFARVAPSYPIVFVKNDDGEVGAYALLGLPAGKNLFVDNKGRWRAAYIPAAVRRYPFVLGRAEEETSLALCIDEGSDLLSEEEGEPLFTQQEEPTETLNKAIEFNRQFQAQHGQTAAICRSLDQMGMFRALKARVRMPSGEQHDFKGFLAIDEKSLGTVPDDEFLQWRKRGWLPLIYAHLISLGQVAHLAERYDQRGGGDPDDEGS